MFVKLVPITKFVAMKTKRNTVNVFPILNNHELSGAYRLFEIKGLEPESLHFYKKKQHLINKLSRQLKHPIEIIVKDDKAFLVTRNEATILERLPVDLPTHGGNILNFEDTKEIVPYNFDSNNSNHRKIIKRFLQFAVNGALYNNINVWQPGTGKPFFLTNLSANPTHPFTMGLI